ncbi:MAG TPA: hypothetical protein VM864_03680 [Pyrinomonadaceae bacterium]|jgi:hypothetical protein|nr:hypothetical protein [Pyrinomonadaceae bacterium]
MSSFDEPTAQSGANKARAEANLSTYDDDLANFSMPASSSSRNIEALVQRNPLTALLAALCFGIAIGKLLR